MMKSLPQRGARTATNAKKKTAAAGAKPDFRDVNKNGNRKESMKTAMASAKKKPAGQHLMPDGSMMKDSAMKKSKGKTK